VRHEYFSGAGSRPAGLGAMHRIQSLIGTWYGDPSSYVHSRHLESDTGSTSGPAGCTTQGAQKRRASDVSGKSRRQLYAPRYMRHNVTLLENASNVMVVCRPAQATAHTNTKARGGADRARIHQGVA
jgi:hypothetical protein